MVGIKPTAMIRDMEADTFRHGNIIEAKGSDGLGCGFVESVVSNEG